MSSAGPINELAPKVFISYSWTSKEHQKWVEDLAVRLVSDGVHVVIDFWDLREGQDKYAFMEQMVTDASIHRVLILMDSRYKEKADARKSGVGSESQIMSSELYGKADQRKFVPIVVERDSNAEPFVPVYLNTRIYIDLSPNSDFAEQYQSLLRNIFDKPARQRPVLGKQPAFLTEVNPGSVATRIRLSDFMKAIENGTPNALGHLTRFFDECIVSLSAFQLPSNPPDPVDEQVLSRIQEMKPLRDEVLTTVVHLGLYMPSDSYIEPLHHFLESAASFQYRPKEVNRWNEQWCDQYKFWLHELFITITAIFLKKKRYGAINFLTETEYLYSESGSSHSDTFSIFDKPPRSLYERNDRLELRRISPVADLIKDRADFPNVTFDDLIQADFVLLLKMVLSAEASNFSRWYPSTLVFKSHAPEPLPLFSKANISTRIRVYSITLSRFFPIGIPPIIRQSI